MAIIEHSLKTDTDVVKSELPSRGSRDEDVIASGEGVFVCGEVLGKITASGKFGKFDPAASDGTQTAAAVLLQAANATAADVRVVNLKRTAEVVRQALVFPVGATTNQIAAALNSLEAKGIVARMGV